MPSAFSFMSLQIRTAEIHPDLLRRARQWWLSEFLTLFPERIARWLAGKKNRLLILVPGEETVSFEVFDDMRMPLAAQILDRAQYSHALVDEIIEKCGILRDGIIGIRVPPERMFLRKIILPREAMRSLNEIIVQDLLAKTPFRLDDIYCDYVTLKGVDSSKFTVWQWVIRRDFVDREVASLNIDPRRIAFVETVGGGDCSTPRPIISLHQDKDQRRPFLRRIAVVLLAFVLILSSFAFWIKYSRQQSALNNLNIQIAGVTLKAAGVRAAVEKLGRKQALLSRLRAQKDEYGLLDVWEEITRILPSHTWLTELRLSEVAEKEQQVALTGFSGAGTSLVALVDRSPMFFDTLLTAPIALDPSEGRERFTLQARLKKSGSVKAPAR
jgi:general secretion pathway protein L